MSGIGISGVCAARLPIRSALIGFGIEMTFPGETRSRSITSTADPGVSVITVSALRFAQPFRSSLTPESIGLGNREASDGAAGARVAAEIPIKLAQQNQERQC